MAKLSAVILIAVSMGLLGVVNAQNLDLSGRQGSSTFEQPGKPSRGMSQDTVLRDYGSPQSEVPAIGDPPISRWEYPGFVVFFEYHLVIHSVTKR